MNQIFNDEHEANQQKLLRNKARWLAARKEYLTIEKAVAKAEYESVKAATKRDSIRQSVALSIPKCHLVRLPLEIRHRLYLLCVTDAKPIYLFNPLLKVLPPNTDHDCDESPECACMEAREEEERSEQLKLQRFALLASCRQFYLEARSFYYGSNTFEGSRCEVMKFGLDIGFRCRAQVRHIRLLHPVYQPNYLGAALQFPNLKTLELIDICYWQRMSYYPPRCYCHWHPRWNPEIKISRINLSFAEPCLDYQEYACELAKLNSYRNILVSQDSQVRKCIDAFNPLAESEVVNEFNSPIPPEEYSMDALIEFDGFGE